LALCVQRLEDRRVRRLFAAVRKEGEQRRSVEWAQDLGEQKGGVGVAPLDIVDTQDQWPRARDALQQIAQSADRTPARFLWIRNLEVEHARFLDCLDATQDRKQARERDDVARDELATCCLVELDQMRTERVHDAVESLVRNRLTLVTAAGEHDRVVV